MSLFDNVDEDEDIFAPPSKPARKPQKNIFDDLDESEDFSEKVSESTHKSNTREETPEFFHEVQQDSQMAFFSPGKNKAGDLFKNEDSTEPPPMEEDQKPHQKTDMFGDPLEDIEDTAEPEIEKSFEVIDAETVPSAEEAEKELEAIEREQARLKAEEERRRLEEEEEEIDGGGFSKTVKNKAESVEEDEPPPLPTSDMPMSDVPDELHVADDEPVDDEPTSDKPISSIPSDAAADEKVMQAEKALLEAVDEIEALTVKLNQAQEEVESMTTQVELLREKLTAEREKVDTLEAQLKEKDKEIAALKEAATTKPSRPSLTKRPSSTNVTSASKPTKPAPATATKPTAAKSAPSSSKPPVPKTSVTSSPKMSAKLRSDENRRGQPSVAEAVKKFGGSQEVPKKPSPTTRRTSKGTEPTDKAAIQQKPSSSRTTTKSRKDSSSEKKEEKKVSSPPKPPRTRKQQTSSEEPEEIPTSNMNGNSTNALDAIKMWENKTAGVPDTSTTTKKSLSVQKSLPVVSKLDEERSAKESSVEKEEVNGTEDKPVVDDKENKEEAGDAATTQSHSVSSITRNFKSQSLIERGTRTSPSSGKRGFTPAVIEKCHACNKTVYTVEKLKADDKVYHKNCFKCSYCKKVVGTGTYAANKGEIFCKTHFKMLFKIKGNYDEGFGREQHKKKWGSSAQTEEQATE